jgi:hypothetical protein
MSENGLKLNDIKINTFADYKYKLCKLNINKQIIFWQINRMLMERS